MIQMGPRMWMEGLRGGAACLKSERMIGLKRLLLPVSYWRMAEFAYVWRHLNLAPGSRVLDLGSPKEIAAWLAFRRRYAITSVDVLPAEIDYSARYSAGLGVCGEGAGLVCQRVADGRDLDFTDASFDAAYSISVLEHIPDDGDTMTLRELARVVRPGGLIIFTVPYAQAYRETFVARTVYEREYAGEPLFFERHYDSDTLSERLIHGSEVRLNEIELWNERFPVERFLGWSDKLRAVLSPLEPLLALASLRQVTSLPAKAAFVLLTRA